MTQWVIGCTHFGHKNIIEHADRPFPDVDSMDFLMIREWNRLVKPQDMVFHLGDFAWPHRSQEAVDKYLPQLNGNIVFVQGNHDPKGIGPDFLEVKINKMRVVMCHYPLLDWNHKAKGSIHLHSHTHKKSFKTGFRRGHVGADAIGYRPMKLEDAINDLSRDPIGDSYR